MHANLLNIKFLSSFFTSPTMKNFFSISLLVLGFLAIKSAPAVAQTKVTSYTLVDADANADIQALTEGAVLDLATLPTRNLNVRANTAPVAVGSVVFALSGAQAHSQTENAAPYALFSDYQGNYFAWTPPLGSYTLLATPYDGPNGTGTAGVALTIHFSVIKSVGDAVTSFTLVNADTNGDIQAMNSEMTLDLAALPTRNLNVRANTSPATVGSVVFALSGAQTRTHTENVAPYALFSDNNGAYNSWTPPSGRYSLTATPYAAANASGAAGTALSVSFTVINSSALPVQLTDFTAKEQGRGVVQVVWSTASEVKNREFVVQRSTDGHSFAALGSLAGHGTTSAPHAYSYEDKQLPASVTILYYRLQQVNTDETFSFSSVRTVVVQHGGAVALQAFLPALPDGLIHFTFTGPACSAGSVGLYSIMGQNLGHYQMAADGTGAAPIAGLPTGVYVLQMVSPIGRFTERFVLP
ncbi:MAG: hypothetical protein NVSMB30_14090 [Hymenobacter sp.]